MKKKVILLIISITLILVILFSSSYALLFKSDTTDKQSYTTGVLSITSETTNNSVTLNNSLPMSDSDGANTTPYTFKITNTGNLSYKFNVMLLSTTTENQISAEYIKIKVNDNEVTKLSDLTDGIILSDITLKPEENIEISLRVWLDENTPNTEIGKNFNAKITTEGEAVYTSNNKKALETLTKLGLTKNTGTPDITKTSCTSGCEESTVGIYSAEDDFGTSYYFRGNVENNYFYFAGFYWRIIRINGDGSIRMIYDGTSAHTNGESSTDRQVGTSAFNSDRADNAYVGYMYGTAGSTTYEATHANTNDSTIKTYLDNWYNDNLKGTAYEQYIADTIYCNNREISSGTGIGSTQTVYGNGTSLKCNQVNDRFTINTNVNGVTGNGKLTNPIGLITGDEISFSGGVHENSYLYTANTFWSMTPTSFVYSTFVMLDTSANVEIFEYNKDGSVTMSRVSTSTIGVRPVISIDSSVSISGTGTMDDPFKISAAKKYID